MRTYILGLFYLLAHLCVSTLSAQNYVVGYLPTYNNYPNSIYEVDLNALTHVDIAFSNPDWNGNIYVPTGTDQVVTEAHNNGVQVLLSICGATGDAGTYGHLLQDQVRRENFIQNLVQLTVVNNLDGIDVDIEGNVLNGNDVNAAQYEAFVLGLRDALNAQNKIVTAALGGWFMNQVTNQAAQAFEFIGMMSYDAHGTWTGPGQHSSYDLAVGDFNNWRAKGVEAENLVVGVPFYGYGWGNGNRAWTFNEIVAASPGAENLDYVQINGAEVYYNGIPTIQSKCNFALENAGGIMIWELTQDAEGNNSLLAAIADVLQNGNESLLSANLLTGKNINVSSTEIGLNTPQNLIDRRLTTRWSSTYNDDQWIEVDLDGLYELDSFKIVWEEAYATSFDVQYSLSGSEWITVYTSNSNSSLVNTIDLGEIEARYIRLNCHQRATEFGFSIFELSLFGQELSRAFYGAAFESSSRIEAEDYDMGGEGVAYHDESSINTFNMYRTEGVDIETCNDFEGGYNVAATATGEWLQYSVYVSSSAEFMMNFRVATTENNRSLHMVIDGQQIGESIPVPNTGGWQVWSTVTSEAIFLEEGLHRIRVVMEESLINLNYLELEPASTLAQFGETTTGSVDIFPNPVMNTQIQIFSELSMLRLEVFDLCGIKVLEKKGIASHQEISLLPLNPATYYMKVFSGTDLICSEIVVVSH